MTAARTTTLVLLLVAAGGAAWWLSRADEPTVVGPDAVPSGEGGVAPAGRPSPATVEGPPPREAVASEDERLPTPTSSERPLVRVPDTDEQGVASGDAVRRALADLPNLYLRWADADTRAAFVAARFTLPAAAYEPRGRPEGADLSMLIPALAAQGFHARIEGPRLVIRAVRRR